MFRQMKAKPLRSLPRSLHRTSYWKRRACVRARCSAPRASSSPWYLLPGERSHLANHHHVRQPQQLTPGERYPPNLLPFFSPTLWLLLQEEAAEKREKYKEGKFILEKCAVTLEGCSGDGCYGSASASASSGGRGRFGAGSRSDRCGGSSSIIGWGADNAPFADGGRW